MPPNTRSKTPKTVSPPPPVKSAEQTLVEANATIASLKKTLNDFRENLMEMTTQNAVLKAIVRSQLNPNPYNEAYERPVGMSDKEYCAYTAFRNERDAIYPEYYTERTIAPLEEEEWQERLEEMRADGLWEDEDEETQKQEEKEWADSYRAGIMLGLRNEERTQTEED
jgi:hypothetical protein